MPTTVWAGVFLEQQNAQDPPHGFQNAAKSQIEIRVKRHQRFLHV